MRYSLNAESEMDANQEQPPQRSAKFILINFSESLFPVSNGNQKERAHLVKQEFLPIHAASYLFFV